MKKTIAVLFCTVLLVTGSAVAQPAGGGPPNRFHGPGGQGENSKFGGGGMGCMIEFLDLTDDQVAAWEGIQADHRATMEATMPQLRDVREQIRTELDSDSPDATELGEMMIAAHELQLQMRAAREAMNDAFTELLTSEQREKFELASEFQNGCRGQGRGERSGRRGGGGGFGGPPGS